MNDLNDITIDDGLQALSLFILGEPASKANSRRVVRFGNMSRLIKSQKRWTTAKRLNSNALRWHN